MPIWTDTKEILQLLQLLVLEMERQLLILSAMIDRLRSRWGLPGGLPVIRQRRHRRYRVRPWPTRAELEEEGQYSRPMPMHQSDDPMAYRNFIQMLPELYQELGQRITAEFQRDRTLMRDPVSPGVKLAVTLRHLATADSYTTLQYAFRVASLTIKKFVPEVCDAITRAYRDQVMQCPTLAEDWLLVESVFRRWWNFPHALGALDRRHIPVRCPQGERQPIPQQQGLPLYCTLDPGGWRFQVPVGGHGSSWVRLMTRCSDFQAHQFEAQNRGQQHRLP